MDRLVNTYKGYVQRSDYPIRVQICFFLLIFVIGGIFGFLYEELFYLVESGQLMKRGMTFGPWIPIYGFGAVGIAALAHHFRRRPVVVFLLSLVTAGVLEYLTGLALFKLGGIRLWDYNVEKWNFGNIGGYICLRSVLFFGVSGLLLIYVIYPMIKYLEEKSGKKAFHLVAIIPAMLFVIDFLVSSVILWWTQLQILLEMLFR